MLTQSPYLDRPHTLAELTRLDVKPVAAIDDAAELIAAMVLLEDQSSHDALRLAIDCLQTQDASFARELAMGQQTVDTILEALTTKIDLLQLGDDGHYRIGNYATAGWLGGRGLVRFANLLRPDVPESTGWADALARLAWRHDYREARTSFARELIRSGKIDEVRAMGEWLHSHTTRRLDDLPGSVQFCLWQFAAELMNAGLDSDSERSQNALSILTGRPAWWTSLLNDEAAEAWAESLFQGVGANEEAVRAVSWMALGSHGNLSPQRRSQLADAIVHGLPSAGIAAEILKSQVEAEDDDSITTLMYCLGSSSTTTSRLALEVLLARIDQPTVQKTLLAHIGMLHRDEATMRVVYQLFRTATLSADSLATLQQHLMNGVSPRPQFAAEVLLAQYSLDQGFLDQLEANSRSWVTMLPAHRPAAHVLRKFRPHLRLAWTQLPHYRSFEPDRVVWHQPHDYAWKTDETNRLVALLNVGDDAAVDEIIDAYVAARVLRLYCEAGYPPPNRLFEISRAGGKHAKRLAQSVLAVGIKDLGIVRDEMVRIDRTLVSRVLNCGGERTVLLNKPDALPDHIRRVVQPGWKYVADDDRLHQNIGDDEAFVAFERKNLTLDDSLRPELLRLKAVQPEVSVARDQPIEPSPAVEAEVSPTDQQALLIYDKIAAHLDPARQIKMDETNFKRHLEWLFMHHFGGKSSRQAFAFFYFLAWSFEHDTYSPQYDLLAGTVEKGVLELLPTAIQGGRDTKKYDSSDSMSKAIRNALKAPSFVKCRTFLNQTLFQ